MVKVFDGEVTVQFSFSFSGSEGQSGQESFEKQIVDHWLFSEDKQAYFVHDVEFFISRWNKTMYESRSDLSSDDDSDFYFSSAEETESLDYKQISSEPTYTIAPSFEFSETVSRMIPDWNNSAPEQVKERLAFLNADGRSIEEITDYILKNTPQWIEGESLIAALTSEKGWRESLPLIEGIMFQPGLVKKVRNVGIGVERKIPSLISSAPRTRNMEMGL